MEFGVGSEFFGAKGVGLKAFGGKNLSILAPNFSKKRPKESGPKVGPQNPLSPQKNRSLKMTTPSLH